ncbi:MAG TPA: hypothetical protein VF658_08060 [Pyrinomonadaceae bacterium]|jgi:hypothetical protein
MTFTPETGGATTQEGIYFQNCLTVLRLAQMLAGEDEAYPSLGNIVAVRVEAPTEVDDIVVTYSGGSKEYIQAKISVAPNTPAWAALWQHIHSQYKQSVEAGRVQAEIITLAVRWSPQMNQLANLLERATTADSAEELIEHRLTQPQQKLLQSIRDVLNLDDVTLLNLFRSVKIWQLRFEGDPLGSDSFENEVRRILRGTVEPLENVFSELLRVTADAARRRGTLERAGVISQLKQRGFRIPPGPVETLSEAQRRILEQELAGLKEIADQMATKLKRLRRALAFEASEAMKIQLEYQIQEAEKMSADYTERIGEIESKLK